MKAALILEISILIIILIYLIVLSSVQFLQSQPSDKYKVNTSDSVSNDIIIGSNLGDIIPIQSVIFYNINITYRIDDDAALMFAYKIPTSSAVKGYGITAEYKWYWQELALKKWFLSPRLNYVQISDELTESEVFTLALLINYQFIFDSGLAFCVGWGMGYNTGPSLQENPIQNNSPNAPQYSNWLPEFRIELGYSF